MYPNGQEFILYLLSPIIIQTIPTKFYLKDSFETQKNKQAISYWSNAMFGGQGPKASPQKPNTGIKKPQKINHHL